MRMRLLFSLRRAAASPGFWLLAAANLLFCQCLFWPDMPDSHENCSYLYRLWAIWRAWGEGQWDARWIGEFAHGYGYPIFNFYAPGFNFFTALFRAAGLTYVDSVKAAAVVGNCLGGLGAYCLGRRFWGSRRAGFWTSLIFIFFPYRACDMTIRGDYSELAAVNLIPWALWAFLGLARRPAAGRFLAASALFAAIVWTHNTSALSFAAFLPLFLLAERLAARRPLLSRGVAASAGAAALAIGLSAAMWLPALAEKRHTHIEKMFSISGDFMATERLLKLRFLFDHDWRYNISAEIDPKYGINMPFGLGWPAWGAAAGALALAAAGRRRRFGRRWRARIAALWALFAGLLFLTLEPSRPFWAHAPLAYTLQFPWRLLGFAAPMAALLAGGAAVWFAPPRRWLALVLMTGAAAGAAALAAPSLKAPGYLKAEDERLEATVLNCYRTTSALNEFLPIHAPWAPVGYEGEEHIPRGGTLQAVRGPGAETAVIEPLAPQYMHWRRYRIRLDAEASFGWGQFLFPGWRASANGNPVALDRSKSGLILFDLGPGDHLLELRFADTPVRRAAKIANLACLIGAVAAGAWAAGRRWKRSRAMPREGAR